MCVITSVFPPTHPVVSPDTPGGARELEAHAATDPAPIGSPETTGPNPRRASSVGRESKPFRIVSHNINGARGNFEIGGTERDLGKLEVLSLKLHDWKVDAILVQETWLLDDWVISSQGCTVIHHGPKVRPSNRGGGGMAIILGPRAKAAWKNAGNPDPFRPGNIAGLPTTRFMGINLRFIRKGKPDDYFVGNIYGPHSDLCEKDEGLLDRFYNIVDSELAKLPQSTTIILGGDFNAGVGIRQHDTDKPILGPYGLPRLNNRGERVLDLARTRQLRVATMYFIKKSYDTHINSRNGQRAPFQIDHFLCSQSLGARLTNAGKFNPPGGVISDHNAIILSIRTHRRHKRNHANVPAEERICRPPRPAPKDWSALHRDPAVKSKFNLRVDTELRRTTERNPDEPLTPTDFSEALNTAATETLPEKEQTESNWFADAEETLGPLRDAARSAHQRFRKTPGEQTRNRWHHAK